MGAVRGALADSETKIPLAFAADFAARTLGSALEQYISEGKVSARKSIIRGLTNMASNTFYGTGKLGSLREAFLRGAGAGATSSGINYIFDALDRSQLARSGQFKGTAIGMSTGPVYGGFRNPRNGCGSVSPFDTSLGYSSAKGYRYKATQTRNISCGNKGFSLGDFVKEIAIGGITGGLASAAFYGACKG